MSCPSAILRAFVLVLVTAVGGRAQTYIVDDVGPADFTSLGQALSSVPDGSTIITRRAFEGAISITKSVSIVGDPSCGPSVIGDPAVVIDGDSIRVRIQGLTIWGHDVYYFASSPAVDIRSASVVLVQSCSIRGADRGFRPGDARGSVLDGIHVSGHSDLLRVEGSTILAARGPAGDGLSETGDVYPHVFGGDGVNGIGATNADKVIVINSVVQGGDGGDAYWHDGFDGDGDPIDYPPDHLEAGNGGNAIVGNAFVSNCTLTPGVGGVFTDPGNWGVGVDGVDGVPFVGHRVGALEVERVSTDSAGAQADSDSGGSQRIGISADGLVVAFVSNATNIVPGDLNSVQDVFVRDQLRGTTTRVSIDSSGTEADGRSQYIALSGDGNVVAFSSQASNLVPGDTNLRFDVFVHDRSTGATERVSVGPGGIEGDEWSGTSATALSYDGRYVAFDSDATNLVAGDTNGSVDVFVWDRSSGTNERVSVGQAGAQGLYGGYGPRISTDGRFVVFTSDSPDLVAGDANGKTDIFIRDRQTGTTERVSLPSAGGEANGRSFTSAISDDGRWVTFDSDADNLVAGDTNGVMDVFVRDRLNGTTIRVSVASDGTQADDFSDYPVISGDGRFIVYVSRAGNLVPDDTGMTDIFRYDVTTGRTSRQSVDARQNPANSTSQTPATNFDGEWIAFHSFGSDLVEGDTNGLPDVFLRSAHCVDAAWSNYGVGFPGTNGIPTLTAAFDPLLGSTVSADLSNSYGQPTLAVVLVGFQDIYLPTKKSGTYLVLPLISVTLNLPATGATIDADLDEDDALCGFNIYVQAIQVDPGAAKGVSFTPGLDLLLGR